MKNTITLEVIGDAMAPKILDGDTLYVDPSRKPSGNAKDVAILKVDEVYHVCKFTRYANQILLIHDNAPIFVVRSDKVEIIGKVIGGSFIPENEENQPAGNELVHT